MAVSTSSLASQATSTTSSGFTDGLGRRALAFDREEGVMLERLVLRPELGAFEGMLRDRLDRLASLEDERIARPRTIERDLDGSLVVVSEFVPGSRLADLLETAAEAGTAPGVDAALGFLLDVLPALCGLHAGAGFAHGSISPSRTVLTPAGQIVLLDAIYGGALAHLRYSRRKLWTDLAIATSPRVPAQRIHVETDIAQAALAAVMLVLGRPLRADEYPDGLAAVAREVADVAQIRGSVRFASGFQTFLNRALQLQSAAPYTAADDALFEVRDVAGELGLNVCRRALVDFIEQMEFPQSRRAEPEDDLATQIARFGLGLDDEEPAGAEDELVAGADDELNLEAAVDAEVDLDSLVERDDHLVHDVTELEIFPAVSAPEQDGEEAVDWIAAAAESTRDGLERSEMPAAAAPPEVMAQASPDVISDAPAVEPQQVPTVAADAAFETTPVAAPAEADANTVRSKRAKRATRSARARKDKLRSAATESPALVQASAPAAPPPVAKKTESPWLVAPQSAAAFEPAVPEPVVTPVPVLAPVPLPVSLAPPPAPVTPAAPRLPVFAAPAQDPFYVPPTPAPVLEPAFSRTVGSIAPSYDTPPAWTPPAVAAPAPPAVALQPQFAPVKMKDSGVRPRTTHTEAPLDIYSTPLPVVADASTPASGFPWKLVAALVIIVVGAIVGGRVYLPAKGVNADENVPAPATAVAPPPAAPVVVPSATTGRLEIETQPAGARILIDGKAAGESPVALDGIAAGRHTITLISTSGSIKRMVRIEAGRTAKLDVPIFSGWVGIYAPFVVEVAEGGRVIGTTEEPRLMLSPGKHDLTLVNRDLGYSSAQSVEIEPGEVNSISIDPRGTVNLNALPWAEVWVDGRKVGDTPMANLQLPLGTREVTFRHPQLGERRVSVTVKGTGAAAVSIDLTKPGN